MDSVMYPKKQRQRLASRFSNPNPNFMAKDVLGRPLVSASAQPDIKPGITVTNLTRGGYDPTLLVDEATNATYVCFRVRDRSQGSDFAIARLTPNLTALAEPPRRTPGTTPR